MSDTASALPPTLPGVNGPEWVSVWVVIVGLLRAEGTRWESFVRNIVVTFFAVLALLFAVQVCNEPWCPPPRVVDPQGICQV
jgi:hypothetical protein